MESQGPQREGGGVNPTGTAGGIQNVPAAEFRAHHTPIPSAPFFRGFSGAVNQMPFIYPHPFMPSHPGVGFTAPRHGYPSPTIDLTEGSQSQCPPEVVPDQKKPTKKRRIAKKKVEVVELDDVKEDADVVKNGGDWKDHWVI